MGQPSLSDALDGYHSALSRFVAFADPRQPVIAALWATATHTVDEWWHVPYLHITSPEADSGKSTLLKVLAHLVAEPVMVASISTAYLYRKLDEGSCTLLIDEFDNLMHSDQELAAALAGILNVGYDRETSHVGRTEGTKHRPVEFDCFGFKVFAGIGSMNQVVGTRTLKVQLQRALPGEVNQRYLPRRGHHTWLQEHRAVMLEALNGHSLGDDDPADVPEGVVNRLLDLWLPLLGVADAAGGVWPDLARDAAAWSVSERPQTHGAILRDLHLVLSDDQQLITSIHLNGRGRITPSDALVAALRDVEDAPWGDAHGRRGPLSARRLTELLKPYSVSLGHRAGRGNDKSPAGALMVDLAAAFARHGMSVPSSLTPSQGGVNAVPSSPDTVMGQPGTASDPFPEEVREGTTDHEKTELPDPY